MYFKQKYLILYLIKKVMHKIQINQYKNLKIKYLIKIKMNYNY